MGEDRKLKTSVTLTEALTAACEVIQIAALGTIMKSFQDAGGLDGMGMAAIIKSAHGSAERMSMMMEASLATVAEAFGLSPGAKGELCQACRTHLLVPGASKFGELMSMDKERLKADFGTGEAFRLEFKPFVASTVEAMKAAVLAAEGAGCR